MAWLSNLSLLDSFQLSLALPLCPYSLSLSWAVARTPSLCPAELLLSLPHCNSDPIAALLSPRAPYCLNKASPQLLGDWSLPPLLPVFVTLNHALQVFQMCVTNSHAPRLIFWPQLLLRANTPYVQRIPVCPTWYYRLWTEVACKAQLQLILISFIAGPPVPSPASATSRLSS